MHHLPGTAQSSFADRLFAGAMATVAFAAVACSSSNPSPTAPPDLSADVLQSGVSEPASRKDTQALTLGLVSFQPTLTYIANATVTITEPTAPFTLLAVGATGKRGEVKFQIPSSFTSVLVDVDASGYTPQTDFPLTLPLKGKFYIELTPS